MPPCASPPNPTTISNRVAGYPVTSLSCQLHTQSARALTAHAFIIVLSAKFQSYAIRLQADQSRGWTFSLRSHDALAPQGSLFDTRIQTFQRDRSPGQKELTRTSPVVNDGAAPRRSCWTSCVRVRVAQFKRAVRLFRRRDRSASGYPCCRPQALDGYRGFASIRLSKFSSLRF